MENYSGISVLKFKLLILFSLIKLILLWLLIFKTRFVLIEKLIVFFVLGK